MTDLSNIKPRQKKNPTNVQFSEHSCAQVLDECVWDIFDKIVCIHYLPYQDRVENIKNELRRVGILDLPQFQWYYTIDNDFYDNAYINIKQTQNNYRLSKKNIKYTIDSFALLKKLQFLNCEHVLILEDDVVFRKDCESIREIIRLTPSDYDIINYDPEILYNNDGTIGTFSRINKYIYKYANSKVVNMSCCALTRKAINHIVESQKKYLQPFDFYTWNDVDSLNTYCVSNGKHLCIQNADLYDNKQTEKPLVQKYPFVNIGEYNVSNGNFTQVDNKVMISFATYSKRFNTNDFKRFIDSIVNQKCQVNYGIVCTMHKDDYGVFPDKLKTYFKQHRIQIIVSEFNFKSNLKYLYAMQRYVGIPIITVDDDMVYSDQLVERLYSDYEKNKDSIICGRCKKVEYTNSGMTKQYSSWKLVTDDKSSIDYFPTGVGGVLYPPEFTKHIQIDVGNIIIENNLVEKDDFVLHLIAMKTGIKTKLVTHNGLINNKDGGYLVKSNLDISSFKFALWRSNVVGAKNDTAISLFDKNSCNLDVVVSFTTYPHRFTDQNFIKCLESLIHQDTKYKYKVVMNVFKGDACEMSNSLQKYIQENDVELILCDKDIRQHKKYLYAMMKYKNTPVITVDDDVIYSSNLVEDMMTTHLANPSYIVCGRCNMIEYDDGRMKKYEQWKKDVIQPGCKDDGLFGVGVGGILYPKDFCKNVDNRFLDIIPKIRSDDFLLHIVAKILGFKYMVVQTCNAYNKRYGCGFFGREVLPFYCDDQALWIVNQTKNYKDECIKYIGKFKTIDELVLNIKGKCYVEKMIQSME